jgi:hypothetical protein
LHGIEDDMEYVPSLPKYRSSSFFFLMTDLNMEIPALPCLARSAVYDQNLI